ncbi:chromate efflux transporter [Shewanella fidelis]|uniref:Chromate efflux transporter n=1 Tax=Shewanella fidelis TaxID=173509 RepID=A0AAW8NQQ1_9GAMM|nr:chromate efflux transporter [Shewanella fidelis]MDR8525076.1 chromate efflux transporter [Shewanella fidelis]MDW4811147.1 chromate efflux transporter [Shewanella fidelis]MDW4815074.1 chromate efflux transporter [Shewanella fidelis]MDW4819164.1 chromate efflux transporter [Shewanella fidelis]MDW4823158.1 chromate efflux transporter [Shewanella fidelis]
MLQIFLRFFSLGLVSFGGPAAHIGYFRQTFVQELNWLDDKHYGSLVALSQFMPGPGSSQVGFAIGYHRGGLLGGIAAFLGFTLPSFILLFLLAVTSSQWLDYSFTQGIIHGLKLLAVVVVADAIWIMFKQFCQRKQAKLLMMFSCVIILLQPSMLMQFGLLIAAALVGRHYLSSAAGSEVDASAPPLSQPVKLNFFWLSLFAGLLIASLVAISLSSQSSITNLTQLFSQFYQVGSMVFGGGHVVLPLLQQSVGDSISHDQFLTGYALAQAVPGPMFALAAFLGAEIWIEQPLIGALVATLAIFLPGFLLMLVALKSWNAISAKPQVTGAIAGVNACVVGFLLAALYTPIFTSAVLSPIDMALVVLGFGIFKTFKPNIFFLVAGFGVTGALIGAFVS